MIVHALTTIASYEEVIFITDHADAGLETWSETKGEDKISIIVKRSDSTLITKDLSLITCMFNIAQIFMIM